MTVFTKHKQASLSVGVLLFNIFWVLIITRHFGFCFEENDDVTMCMIANGMYTGTPDCHLVFINALYGSMLVGLYQLSPTIEWYTWSFLFLPICAMTTIVSCIVKSMHKNILLYLAFVLLFYAIWVTWLQLIQFTTTAAICTIAGCMLLQCKRLPILASSFVFIGSLIRFEAAALVVLIFTPLFLYTYRKEWKWYVLLCGIGLVVLCAKGADSLFYQTPEWKYYREWNAIRGTLNDNPNLHNIYNADIDASIALEDVQLLTSFFADPAVWSMPLLQKAQQVVCQERIIERVGNLEHYKPYIKYLSTLCLVGTLLLAYCVFLKRQRSIACTMGIWSFVLLLGTSVNGTVKDRVFVALIFALTICILLIYSNVQMGG